MVPQVLQLEVVEHPPAGVLVRKLEQALVQGANAGGRLTAERLSHAKQLWAFTHGQRPDSSRRKRPSAAKHSTLLSTWPKATPGAPSHALIRIPAAARPWLTPAAREYRAGGRLVRRCSVPSSASLANLLPDCSHANSSLRHGRWLPCCGAVNLAGERSAAAAFSRLELVPTVEHGRQTLLDLCHAFERILTQLREPLLHVADVEVMGRQLDG